jgi:hypothetical protein
MWSRPLHSSLVGLVCAASLAAQQAPPRQAHELLASYNRLQVDPSAVYKIEPTARIELRRGDGKLLFDEGYIAFYAPLGGKVTGAVFSGRGHILAAPRDPVEKQQLALFLGAPVLDQDFSNAYLRFTDDTAEELAHQFQSAKISAEANTAFADAWQPAALARNPSHSFRILSESFSQTVRHYFVATIGGTSVGTFDFAYDQVRDEQQLIGQGKKVAAGEFYDVWASYRIPGLPVDPAAFRATQYKIETTIRPDNTLAGETVVRVHVDRAGERLIGFQFSRQINIDGATLALEPVPTFPDEKSPQEERSTRNGDVLFVLLPNAPKPGEEFELTLRYHGNVITDAGNGVLFVGSRESWYPHLGGSAEFSTYDLTFHWPKKFRLAATGVKLEEREEGEVRTGHWRTEKPASVAGFNLGEYAFASLASNNYSIDVYANKQLEQALLDRLRRPEVDTLAPLLRPLGGATAERLSLPPLEPRPADALKQLAKDIDASIRFYETSSGPFPVRQLSVSQIPGSFGQGWPGLLYLSTFSFLPAEAQQRAGLSANSQEHFHDLVPFHEVAHQWWGNVVSWSNYRDQWIDEGMASYLSLLFADSQKTPDHRLRAWLERFRKKLLEKDSSEIEPANLGGLILGSRLNSSKNPDGFDKLVYPKGAWIFHMLHEMLHEPGNKNPDARFISLLRKLQAKYAYRALSTDDLQREVEAVMTPAMEIEGKRSMEWFFADWVRGSGMPHYRIEYSTKQTEKGFLVRGKLWQTGVIDSFVAPVPIYSSGAGYLGRVIAGGPETAFHFVATRDPGRLQIDPQMTLLCVVER